MLDRFQLLTLFNLRGYITRFLNFLNAQASDISGFLLFEQEFNEDAFTELRILQGRTNLVLTKYKQYKEELSRKDTYWDYLTYIESINIWFDGLLKAPKFFRLERENTEIKYLIVRKSLERWSEQQLGDRNSWVNVALKENLFEKDYDYQGTLRINTGQLNRYSIASIIDTIDKQTILGKDVNKDFTFEVDEKGFGDINILTPEETMKQTAQLLISLKKNGNPFFPEYGISTTILGSNENSVTLDRLITEISFNVSTDDSISSIEIDEITRRERGIFITYTITTAASQTFGDATVITT